MILTLSIVLGVVTVLLLAAIVHIIAIQKELEQLNKEQHIQNTDLLALLKYKKESTEMLLQHIEILKYLCERDPSLGRVLAPYTGPVGEA